jgi:hypothetical protein
MSKQHTEIVHASEMQEKVVNRLLHIREPNRTKEYQTALRKYKRRIGRRQEQTFTETSLFEKRTFRGFQVEHMGQTLTFERPEPPTPLGWMRSGYSRSSIAGNRFTDHAHDAGLLADGGRYNRPIRATRVNEYAKEMEAGRWRDLFSDPIAITADGHVLNGQHRIVAVCSLDWADSDYDPAFLVVWNVDPGEALYADGSRRTDKDEKTIAAKLLAGQTL